MSPVQNENGSSPWSPDPGEAVRIFSDYLRITGVAHTGPEPTGDPHLIGKRLGLLNGSSWITLWANYFGKIYLPGVHLVNAGNEAVQINFMEAHARGQPEVPSANIEAFKRYARDLVELGHVNAVLITCSTMNRAYPEVQSVLQPYGIPAMQIDRPMMEKAVDLGGRVLVIATHGPTVESTRALLHEVAVEKGRQIETLPALVEPAWQALAAGEVEKHNELLARLLHEKVETGGISCAILAQLSMSVLLLTYPDPKKEFGIPVFTSGQAGFEAMQELLSSIH